MSADPSDVPTVWQEVRQRRVGKTAVVYLALGFAVIRATAVLRHLAGGPEWVFRAALGVVVLGFPIAVVLAWTYDLTAEGVVRTKDELGTDDVAVPPPRSYAWLVLTLFGVVAGWFLRVGPG